MKLRSLSLFVSLTSLISISSAPAEETPASLSEASAPIIEEVIVTGSLLPRGDFVSKALETKSPRGSNEPVTMTSSIMGALASDNDAGVSSAGAELIEIKDVSETKSERERNFIFQCSKSKLNNRYLK